MLFDEKVFSDIYGYENEKECLMKIIDMLNNPKKYEELGCDMLHGLLLYGPPGTGKTSFALGVMNATNIRNYTIRREGDEKVFLNNLKDAFNDALNHEPAIILLDDMDKFSTSDYNDDIYSSLQSLIDSVKNSRVFIIATVNNMGNLPNSLTRKGRFDIRLEIDIPSDTDSKEIISRYLSSKKIDKDVNVDHVNNIIAGHSCAELESVCKQAGIYAGYKNQKSIKMDDFVKASLELLYGDDSKDLDEAELQSLETVAYHEAGHAIVSYYYNPGNIRFISIAKNHSKRGLIEYHHDINMNDDEYMLRGSLARVLAGKASTELIFNKCDMGANSDLHKAFNIARKLVDYYCADGFDAWFYNSDETSEKTKTIKDEKSSQLVKEYYNKARDILSRNRTILDKLADAILKNRILYEDEINKILKGVII